VKLAVLVEIIESVAECRDSKDDKFLELALNGKAQHIISGEGVRESCTSENLREKLFATLFLRVVKELFWRSFFY
jgi:predicted nucleic acid-binding protein